MRPEQIARLQRLARLRETRARAALGQALHARDALEAERQRLSEHLAAAAPQPGATDAAQWQAAARVDLLFQQGLAAYRRVRPDRDAGISLARADYARALGQLRALAALQEQTMIAVRRKRDAREEEERNIADRPVGPETARK